MVSTNSTELESKYTKQTVDQREVHMQNLVWPAGEFHQRNKKNRMRRSEGQKVAGGESQRGLLFGLAVHIVLALP